MTPEARRSSLPQPDTNPSLRVRDRVVRNWFRQELRRRRVSPIRNCTCRRTSSTRRASRMWNVPEARARAWCSSDARRCSPRTTWRASPTKPRVSTGQCSRVVASTRSSQCAERLARRTYSPVNETLKRNLALVVCRVGRGGVKPGKSALNSTDPGPPTTAQRRKLRTLCGPVQAVSGGKRNPRGLFVPNDGDQGRWRTWASDGKWRKLAANLHCSINLRPSLAMAVERGNVPICVCTGGEQP